MPGKNEYEREHSISLLQKKSLQWKPYRCEASSVIIQGAVSFHGTVKKTLQIKQKELMAPMC